MGGDSELIDLSIIIVSWNTKKYLLPCLRELFEKGRGRYQEVIVVDNGSSDGSGDEVKRAFPSVRIIQNEENLGFARAVNQGFKHSSGRYILLLNPDTRVKDDTTERLLSFMDRHPDAAAAGAQLLNADGSKQNSIANFPTLATELLNKSLLRRLFPEKYPGKEREYSDSLEVDSVIGACMIVRRQAAEQVGMLDEDYFLFLEETDWCYRMKKAGWKIYHVPQARVDHLQGKSAGGVKKKARLEFYRSRYHFFRKNRGSWQWFILLVGLWIRLLMEFVVTGIANVFTFCTAQKLKGKFSVYAHLIWWHLKLCPEGMGLKK